ncbi:TonB-dependent receptor [Zobellia galactanivorans]|uniref:TonB-dependent receptor n=1 Tax=Zobellia galactanivorans (strain DSM 12802 / CCUG 47099 / CIP 106680 / NCIMB 13871 / Dsij) TaxID=63186 RepID=UPI001C0659B9|nr:TonB-dependent receptor [Zobellia galactanivorans]MBU3028396.1 TonB-dependent receptor [Zobellia galactanivorans]
MKKAMNRRGLCQPLLKFDLKMKLTTLLLMTTLFGLYANDSYAQKTKVTLNVKNATVRNVIDNIESSTDFRFIYKTKDVDLEHKISLRVSKESIKKVLESLFGNTNTVYKVRGTHIILRRSLKEQPSPETILEDILIDRGQDFTVTGTITDGNGMPLSGANIVEKGTVNGVTADFDGNFSLSVADVDAVLVVSYIGFATKEVSVNGRNSIAVSLEESAAALEEIVVVGYGTQKKKDLTGAVSSVDGEDIQNSAKTSIDQMLQGKVAGVRISQTSGQPGGGVSIRIRGNSSLNTSNEPLYVIDGMPIDNSAAITDNGPNISSSAPPNPLNTINPQDIESIQVLKDASATAIYGSRGANGVILITTKSGKEGQLKIDYSTSVGIQKVANPLNVLDGNEYVENIGDILSQSGSSLQPELSNSANNVDWQDQIFRSAATLQHNLSLSGGSAENKYFASFNYTDQEGILIGSGFKRYGGRLNWKHTKDKFSASVNINTSLTEDDITPHGSSGNFDGGVISTAVFLPGTVPVYNSDGSYFKPRILDLDNPLSIANGIDVKGSTNRTLVNLKTSYEVLRNVEASISLNADNIYSKKNAYRSRLTIVGEESGGVASIITSKSSNYVLEALLNYKNSFGDHSVSGVAGYTYQKNDFQWSSSSARGFIGDEVKTDDLSSGDPALNQVGSLRTSDALLSYLSRINYSYLDKLLVTASFRADGSSRLAEGRKWGYFPSFSLGYRLTQEPFMESLSFINNLKARVGWGQIGNVRTPASAAIASFVAGSSAVFNNETKAGLTPARIPNPDLKWETTEQLNIGMDFGLFGSRINGSVDVYNKKTKDLLFQEPVPPQTGFDNWWVNLPDSEITNTGIELSLNTINVKSDKFNWESDLNFTSNRNKITKLDGREIIISSDVVATVANIEGEAAFSYYGLEKVGIWQIGDNTAGSAQPTAVPGQPKWKDQNNDGVINADDRVILGNPYPDFTWGLNNSFSYGGFDLSIFIEGVQGVDLFNTQLANTYFPFNNSRNRFAEPIVNRWTPDNPTNEWPSFVDPSSYGGDLTNAFTIQDASFVRLKNVTLGYNFNLKESSAIRSLSAHISGENLAISTDYYGYDPDLGGTGNSRLDANSYPTSRTFSLGINIGF